jgi:hypothetical protein
MLHSIFPCVQFFWRKKNFNFKIPVPLRHQSWLCMPVLAWFIFLTQSRRGVRLPVNWVNAEWDSTSTESTRSETPHQLSPRKVRLHVNWVNAEGTDIYDDFIITRWLSWRWVSLGIDSVDMKSHFALTQLMGNETPHQLSHRRMLKN